MNYIKKSLVTSQMKNKKNKFELLKNHKKLFKSFLRHDRISDHKIYLYI